MGDFVRVVAMSDTHGKQCRVPDGDVLVHAGDLTPGGRFEQVESALEWIAGLPHAYKVVIAGNHDGWFQKNPGEAQDLCDHLGIVYLDDEVAEVGGLWFYGNPRTPRFGDWYFMYERGSEARREWSDLKEGLDVLVTHGPPFGMGDRSHGRSVGCTELLEKLVAMRRPPRLHVFGHIHEDRGDFRIGDDHGTLFANVATDYGRHPARYFDLEVRT